MNSPVLLFRRCVGKAQAPLKSYQRRWAQVHDIRFYAAHQRPDLIQERYRQKLDEKARERGLKNADELKDAYAEKIQALRKQAVVPGVNAPVSAQQPPSPQSVSSAIPFQPPPPPQPQPVQAPSAPKSGKDKTPIKTLSNFIDVEKTAELSQKEIETIWRLRHVRDGQSLCAVMHSDTYNRVAATAKKHPQFILPLPREGQGAEIHFLQWTFPSETTATVLFTHLAEFKLRGEYAQPHTTITHHLDLADRNGLVLLEGRVQEDRGVSVDEGKFLLMNLQKFYGFEAHSDVARENAQTRRKLMEQFSGGDENFKVEELLEETEKVP
ncbi:ATP11, mitochondrial [Lecanosticta acicola]|uniref:ATP11, mitochondrial n=1 Tax=Lecanosticta acicola TaxID=111012 RepID=A0AAI8YYU6_9PEZI|nr:ATP11, mitochondrial [Lecanosticta acicola]